jgi:hypothetical protein
MLDLQQQVLHRHPLDQAFTKGAKEIGLLDVFFTRQSVHAKVHSKWIPNRASSMIMDPLLEKE